MPAADKKKETTAASKGLHRPLTELRGISAKRAELFHGLGIDDQIKLLFYFPRAYDDWSVMTPLSELIPDTVQTFRAHIAKMPTLQRKGKLSWVKTRLSDGEGFIDAVWFNQSWLARKFNPGDEFIFHGRIQENRGRIGISNPWYISAEEGHEGGISAMYGLCKGLTQKLIREAVAQVLDGDLPSRLTDPLPEELRRRFKLCTLDFAIRRIHQPQQAGDIQLAKRRLAFEELFMTRSAMSLMKEKRLSQSRAHALVTTHEAAKGLHELVESLPYTPTSAQVDAVNDILRDLRRDEPMNRLLQGDVGSGKTLVAALAMAYTAWCGGQSMLMAPTSILAEQHYRSLQRILSPFNLGLDLLTGRSTAKERREILERCADGNCHILIGTHALLQDDIVFKNLNLTVTDEQHRFGVRQRGALGEQGEGGELPHRLVMSATPIPRTLALIVYGDLDLSIMREMPGGRRQIKTYTARSTDMPRVYDLSRREIEAGGQAYVVCPLIEDSELMELDSAEAVYDELRKKVFPDLKLALLHGRVKGDEKERIMLDFLSGETKILVSTTVVEVGVDNPNASLMLIMNAERFGLAQLHQLRGRVGRGTRQSYCILQSDARDEGARERLRTLCRHADGFDLAEEDLRLRGPGDFFGTKQHGLPAFKLLNLYEDTDLIEQVNEAVELVEALPSEEKAAFYARLHQGIAERYPEMSAGMTL